MNTELLETFTKLPPQHQDPPGEQEKMVPKPIEEDMAYVAAGKLKGKVAIITGGDSGIGRSIAIQFTKEGADICIVCLNEEDDAEMTAAIQNMPWCHNGKSTRTMPYTIYRLKAE